METSEGLSEENTMEKKLISDLNCTGLLHQGTFWCVHLNLAIPCQPYLQRMFHPNLDFFFKHN